MEKIKVSDYEEVIRVVSKYTEGCKAGKSDIMKPAFTENALMYGYLNGQLFDGSIDALYGAVDQFGPPLTPRPALMFSPLRRCRYRPGSTGKLAWHCVHRLP